MYSGMLQEYFLFEVRFEDVEDLVEFCEDFVSSRISNHD